MTTQLTLFEGQTLPAHLQDWGIEDNVVARDQIPQLSFRGKVWRLVLKGKEEVVNASDGEPAASVQVVILDYNKARSRAYYPGNFEEGKTRPPICWSNDGVKPDENVKEKQSVHCADCKWAAKGSRVTDSGKESVACTQYKRAVVVPSVNVKFEPLLLKIPQTSIWDKDNEENEKKGLYAYDQYMDMLKRHGIMHTAKVITRVKFDSRTAYPKLLFKAEGLLPEEVKGDVLAQIAQKEKLTALLNTMPDMAGGERETAPAPEAFVEQAQPATAAPAAPAATAAPAPQAAAPAAQSAKATRPRPAKPQAPAPVQAAPVVDPEDSPGVFGAAAPAASATPVSTAKPTATNGLANLLSGWDDKAE